MYSSIDQLIQQVKGDPLLVGVCRAVEAAADILGNLDRFITECGPTLLRSHLALGERVQEADEDIECRFIVKHHPLERLAQAYQDARALDGICDRLIKLVEERAPTPPESP
jgi:hypothetical protein